jgi:excisionase family DNA binding protein
MANPDTYRRLPAPLTISECVEAINGSYSATTLRREIAAGNLKARRLGRTLRILDEDLADWLRSIPTQVAA